MQKNSIGQKLTGSYILVSFVTLIILETMFYFALSNYYYKGVEQNLMSNAESSAALYNKFSPSGSIKDKKLFIFDSMDGDEDALVELYGVNHDFIINNLNSKTHIALKEDYDEALNHELSIWRGRLENGESIISVSVPLLNGEKVVGVLRYVSGLDEVKKVMRSNLLTVIVIGLVILFLSGSIGYFMSNRILVPIKHLTKVTKEISEGNLDAVAKKYYDDEIGQLSDAVNRMTVEIKKSNQEKSDFISSISHELRTPLTSIKGWAETIEDSLEDKETTEMGLSVIERETNRLIILVNDLLDFSKLQSHRIELDCEKLELNQFISGIMEQFAVRFVKDGIKLSLNFDKEKIIVFADKNRLKQVLINIIDNSLKFIHSSNNPTVSVGCYVVDDEVIIYVEDNGIGMEASELARVKEKFFKGNNKMSGTGLGLAIANEIIALHQGTFYIDSIRNVGSKVSVILPYYEGEELEEFIRQFYIKTGEIKEEEQH